MGGNLSKKGKYNPTKRKKNKSTPNLVFKEHYERNHFLYEDCRLKTGGMTSSHTLPNLSQIRGDSWRRRRIDPKTRATIDGSRMYSGTSMRSDDYETISVSLHDIPTENIYEEVSYYEVPVRETEISRDLDECLLEVDIDDVVEKLRHIKKRIKLYDGKEDYKVIVGDLEQCAEELDAVPMPNKKQEFIAHLSRKIRGFKQAINKKHADLALANKQDTSEDQSKVHFQSVVALFAEVTTQLDAIKEDILNYYGASEDAEYNIIVSRLNQVGEIIRQVDPRGNVSIVLTKEQYEDYTNRLKKQFEVIVEESERNFKQQKHTLSTMDRNRDRRKRSQMLENNINIKEVHGKLSVDHSAGYAPASLINGSNGVIEEEQEQIYSQVHPSKQRIPDEGEKQSLTNTSELRETAEVVPIYQDVHATVSPPNGKSQTAAISQEIFTTTLRDVQAVQSETTEASPSTTSQDLYGAWGVSTSQDFCTTSPGSTPHKVYATSPESTSQNLYATSSESTSQVLYATSPGLTPQNVYATSPDSTYQDLYATSHELTSQDLYSQSQPMESMHVNETEEEVPVYQTINSACGNGLISKQEVFSGWNNLQRQLSVYSTDAEDEFFDCEEFPGEDERNEAFNYNMGRNEDNFSKTKMSFNEHETSLNEEQTSATDGEEKLGFMSIFGRGHVQDSICGTNEKQTEDTHITPTPQSNAQSDVSDSDEHQRLKLVHNEKRKLVRETSTVEEDLEDIQNYIKTQKPAAEPEPRHSVKKPRKVSRITMKYIDELKHGYADTLRDLSPSLHSEEDDCFSYSMLGLAAAKARNSTRNGTDDEVLVESSNYSNGDSEEFKEINISNIGSSGVTERDVVNAQIEDCSAMKVARVYSDQEDAERSAHGEEMNSTSTDSVVKRTKEGGGAGNGTERTSIIALIPDEEVNSVPDEDRSYNEISYLKNRNYEEYRSIPSVTLAKERLPRDAFSSGSPDNEENEETIVERSKTSARETDGVGNTEPRRNSLFEDKRSARLISNSAFERSWSLVGSKDGNTVSRRNSLFEDNPSALGSAGHRSNISARNSGFGRSWSLVGSKDGNTVSRRNSLFEDKPSALGSAAHKSNSCAGSNSFGRRWSFVEGGRKKEEPLGNPFTSTTQGDTIPPNKSRFEDFWSSVLDERNSEEDYANTTPSVPPPNPPSVSGENIEESNPKPNLNLLRRNEDNSNSADSVQLNNPQEPTLHNSHHQQEETKIVGNKGGMLETLITRRIATFEKITEPVNPFISLTEGRAALNKPQEERRQVLPKTDGASENWYEPVMIEEEWVMVKNIGEEHVARESSSDAAEVQTTSKLKKISEEEDKFEDSNRLTVNSQRERASDSIVKQTNVQYSDESRAIGKPTYSYEESRGPTIEERRKLDTPVMYSSEESRGIGICATYSSEESKGIGRPITHYYEGSNGMDQAATYSSEESRKLDNPVIYSSKENRGTNKRATQSFEEKKEIHKPTLYSYKESGEMDRATSNSSEDSRYIDRPRTHSSEEIGGIGEHEQYFSEEIKGVDKPTNYFYEESGEIDQGTAYSCEEARNNHKPTTFSSEERGGIDRTTSNPPEENIKLDEIAAYFSEERGIDKRAAHSSEDSKGIIDRRAKYSNEESSGMDRATTYSSEESRKIKKSTPHSSEEGGEMDKPSKEHKRMHQTATANTKTANEEPQKLNFLIFSNTTKNQNTDDDYKPVYPTGESSLSSLDYLEEERDVVCELPVRSPSLDEDVEIRLRTVRECMEEIRVCIRFFDGAKGDEEYDSIYENLFSCMAVLNKVKSSEWEVIEEKQRILREITECMNGLEAVSK